MSYGKVYENKSPHQEMILRPAVCLLDVGGGGWGVMTRNILLSTRHTRRASLELSRPHGGGGEYFQIFPICHSNSDIVTTGKEAT